MSQQQCRSACRILFFSLSTAALVLRGVLSGDLTFLLTTFTIQSNLLVWLWWLITLTAGKSRFGEWIASPPIKGALTLYILMTGSIYQLLLADGIMASSPLQAVILNINHGVTPAAFLLDWLLFSSNRPLPLQAIAAWLAYPLLYLAISILYGIRTGYYIYYFFDYRQLGESRFFQLLLILTSFTIATALLLRAGYRLLSSRRQPEF